jgi:hypothetical protein
VGARCIRSFRRGVNRGVMHGRFADPGEMVGNGVAKYKMRNISLFVNRKTLLLSPCPVRTLVVMVRFGGVIHPPFFPGKGPNIAFRMTNQEKCTHPAENIPDRR